MEIVLVRLSALGDVVHTWPLAVALREACPEARLTWVVEAPLAPLVEGHPAVDRVVTSATRRWRSHPFAASTRGEIAALRAHFEEPPELCIDAQGVAKSALVTRWTGARQRVGLARPWRRELLAGLAYTGTVPAHDGHVVARNLELVRAVGCVPPAVAPPPDGRWLLEHLPPVGVDGPLAVLLPGAGRPGKLLPVSVLATIARNLRDAGLAVSVVWGPAEQARAGDVVAAAGGAAVAAPPTDLGELVARLGAATLVIGSDTGPVHLAASLGTPTVAVFTTTSPDRNGPLGPRVAVVSGVDPSHIPRGGASRVPTLRAVTAKEITQAALDFLAKSKNE